jgi:arylesterase/paraoxonase
VNRTRRALLVVIGIMALALLALLAEIGRLGGMFRSVEARAPGPCAAVTLGGSAEDIQVDARRGLAYLSVLDRASLARGQPVEGSIMLLDLNLDEPAPRAALAWDPPGFRPHGLSLLEKGGEPARLFAISHAADGGHRVEIFENEAGGGFFPRQSVRDPLLVHPNAIVAVGARQFYVANDTTRPEDGSPIVDALLRRGNSDLVYFDGGQSRVVASGLRFAAGMAISPDGQWLYVGEAQGEQMRVYRREVPTGDLVLQRIVPLGTSPDNLNVDADGVVWVAAHPKLFAFLAHVKEPARRSPTQVLRYDPRNGQLTEHYESNGSPLSAGSVAAHWRDEIVIGAVFDNQVLICKNPP